MIRGTIQFRSRLGVGVLCAALVAVPFLAVHYAPITDLPQHVAQVRLFLDVLHSPESPYCIQWPPPPYLAPYALIGVGWMMAGPLAAGRLAMMAVGWLWTAGFHALASSRGRSAGSAVLVSALFFNGIMQYGFYSFLLGGVLFPVWMTLQRRLAQHPFRRLEWGAQPLALLVLYFTHALWFALAILWQIAAGALRRAPARDILRRALALVPACIPALFWYPQLARSGFTSPPLWITAPWERLAPGRMAHAAWGALTGPADSALALLLLLWIAAALWHHRDRFRAAIDPECLAAAALFAVLYLLLPEKFQNTIEFNRRWFPFAVAFLLLGLPAPRLRPALQQGAPLAVLAALSLLTTFHWRGVEQHELSGLDEALRRLPERPRVLGLDFSPRSRYLKQPVFMQVMAYSQILHGGEVSFSFARFPTAWIVYRDWDVPPWMRGYEWFPRRIFEHPDDFGYFDFALIHCRDPHDAAPEDERHAYWQSQPFLEPQVSQGQWRLYRILPPSP